MLAVQKWEYLYELRKREPNSWSWAEPKAWTNDVASKLEALGEEGWELVAISPRSGLTGESVAGITTEELWVFKRPKE